MPAAAAPTAVDTTPVKRGHERRSDGLHVAGAAEFGDEAPSGTERPVDAGDGGVGRRDPVQRRVAEDGVELAGELQRRCIADRRRHAARASRGDLFSTAVEGHDLGAGSGDPLAQHAVTAAEVEDPLTRSGIEQCEHLRAEIGDEARRAGVLRGIPPLRSPGHHRVPPVQNFCLPRSAGGVSLTRNGRSRNRKAYSCAEIVSCSCTSAPQLVSPALSGEAGAGGVAQLAIIARNTQAGAASSPW